ncbi:hypothetical protein [Rhodococcus sp. W8901]|uniref:hypothetical protein n=1 Tax=Rhodococcus sp. W8901 TaxID=2742603 RepID=UPI0015832CBE|nr:hypothetical protein [Rhodococcus sp. W8901]QKT09614.1 hypothetical protein HUN07_01685 [Rhodococcus sp. W8901]
MSDYKYDINGLRFNEPQFSEAPLLPGAPSGILYVIEFSSGWVKVGQTASSRSDTERLDSVGREFRASRGWDVTNRWISDVRLSTTDKFSGTEYFDRKDRRSCSLDVAEKRVKDHVAKFAVRLSEVNPLGCKGETETFLGVSFGYLVAYTDVTARCM